MREQSILCDVSGCCSGSFQSRFQTEIRKIGHDWVQAEFSRAFVSGSKRFSHLKGFLNMVQEWRDAADYSDEEISEKRAKRNLDKALFFIGEISKEIRK